MLVEKPSRELYVTEIIYRTFRLYFSRFILFFLPVLISGLITGLFSTVLLWSFPPPSPPSPDVPPAVFFQWFWAFFATLVFVAVLAGIVSWIIGNIATGMIVKSSSDLLEKRNATLHASFNVAMSKLASLLGASIVTGILIFVGFLLLFIPGIILMIMFSLVVPAIVIEQKGMFDSLGRSRMLVSRRWWKTFVLLLVIGLIMLAVGWIASLIAVPFGGTALTADSFGGAIVGSIVTSVIFAFVAPIFPIATTYLYYSMMARETAQLPPPPPPML